VKVAIIVASVHHGNTRKIAVVMARELSASLFRVEDVCPETLAGYDVAGFGSGIYFGRHHKRLIDLIDKLDRIPQRVFVFSTAGLPRLRQFWHAGLKRRLARKGCQVIGEFCCPGWDTVGPLRLLGGLNRGHPNERDLQCAVAFSHSIANPSGSGCQAQKSR
jgi:flavodoxin